jgi:hypothetical protein
VSTNQPSETQTVIDPPAEPEALRLMAPQRGLIATGEKQKQLQRKKSNLHAAFDM